MNIFTKNTKKILADKVLHNTTIKYRAIINANIQLNCPDFISKNDMQEKETITNNRYGWKFPALG